MFKKLSKIFKFILDILFPRFCLSCQKEGDWICSNCLATIDILEYEYCPFCMQRVSEQDICIKHQNKNLDKLFLLFPIRTT